MPLVKEAKQTRKKQNRQHSDKNINNKATQWNS